MALQGTLDTFALADLVRLLATTGKTGELAIDGDRGSGRLWFADGQLVGGEPTAGDLAGVVFALLRMEEGEFAFHADTAPVAATDPESALDVLATAEARLEEWRPIEDLVPSPAVALTLRDELTEDEVTIGREVWRRLVAIGSGTTAGSFGAALGLDEQATGFAVRDLVDAGLVEVGDEVEDVPEPTAEVAQPAPVVVAEPVVDTSVDPAPAPAPVPEPQLAPEPPAPAPLVAPVSAAELDTGAEPAEVPPVLGVVPDPPYSFGNWDDSPVPAPDGEADTAAALGPWEPLTPAAATPAAPEALPALEPLPALDIVEEPPAPAAALPSLDASRPTEPTDLGSYAVDLDSQLGGISTGHSYLGTSDAAGGLPEPLLGAEGIPTSDAAALSAPPDPPAPTSYPEPGTGAAEEMATARDHADQDHGWGSAPATSEDLGVPLDSLSPAAARALTAAASADAGDDDTDAGRRVLRRIISTGKG